MLTALVTAAGLMAVALSQGAYDIVDRQSAGLVIWWAVGLGALVAGPPRRPALPGTFATAAAAGIAVWIAVSLDQSISAERSVIELGRAVTHLGPLVLIGWVLPKRLWRAVLAGLALGAVLVCAAALGQRLSPGFLGQTSAIVFANTTARLASPLGYWNAVGSWAVITGLLLLATSTHAPSRVVRAVAIAPLPLTIAVAYLTYSRASIAAAMLGAVVLLALSANRWTLAVHAAATALAGVATIAAISTPIANATGTSGAPTLVVAILLSGAVLAAVAVATGHVGLDQRRMPLRAARVTLAATAVIVVLGSSLAVAQYGSEAWDRFSAQENNQATDAPTARLGMINNGSRVKQWQVAWDDYRAHPWKGTGAGTFELTYNRRADDSQFVRDAHNAFLETLSEQGVIGFGLLAALVLSMIAAVVTAARRAATALDRGLVAGAGAALAAFILGSAVDWLWEVTALALLAMSVLGVVVAAGSPQAPAALSRRTALASRLGTVAAAILAVLVLLPGLVGTSEVRRSEREVAAGDLTAARTHADQAIDILYWASSPYLQRGLVDERAGAWDAAAESLHLAIRRDPYDWRLPLVLARIEAKAGHPDDALDAYRQAKTLRPHGQFFR